MAERKCDRCNGAGKVWCHDRSGDGHGGLNGGSWGYLGCGKCWGTGKSQAELRKGWPKAYTILVCAGCGVQRGPGYKSCEAAGGSPRWKCGLEGHPIKLTVVPPTCSSCGGQAPQGHCEDCEAANG